MTETPQYYVTLPNKMQEGPYSKEALFSRYRAGKYPQGTLVWCPKMSGWELLESLNFDGSEDAAAPQAESDAVFSEGVTSLPPLDEYKFRASYYAHTPEGKKGPFSPDDLNRMLQQGELTVETLVWKEGTDNWGSLREVLTFSSSDSLAKKARETGEKWLTALKTGIASANRVLNNEASPSPLPPQGSPSPFPSPGSPSPFPPQGSPSPFPSSGSPSPFPPQGSPSPFPSPGSPSPLPPSGDPFGASNTFPVPVLQTSAASPVVSAGYSCYYISKYPSPDSAKGPYTQHEVKKMLRKGKLCGREFCCFPGLPQWMPLSNIMDVRPVAEEMGVYPSGSKESPLYWDAMCFFALAMLLPLVVFSMKSVGLTGVYIPGEDVRYPSLGYAAVLQAVAFLAYIIGNIIMSIRLSQAWKFLRYAPTPRPLSSPGLVIGLIFIPLFDFFWRFFTFCKVSTVGNKFLRSRNAIPLWPFVTNGILSILGSSIWWGVYFIGLCLSYSHDVDYLRGEVYILLSVFFLMIPSVFCIIVFRYIEKFISAAYDMCSSQRGQAKNQQYYVALPDKTQEGPMDTQTLLARYRVGKYPQGTLVWQPGGDDWIPIETEIKILKKSQLR